MQKPNKKYMQLAINAARKNCKKIEGGPFGACIVIGKKILAVARNTVLKNDATCHAEINAIRLASRKLKTFDLSGSVIYSTTEPCPMCFSAIHWARIGVVIYGSKIEDVANIGFNELKIKNTKLKALGRSEIKIVPSFMKQECKKLLLDWNSLPNKKIY